MSHSPNAAGRLTTHVLDTASGRPGAGLGLRLERLDESGRALIDRFVTNADGRCATPLLAGTAMLAGVYEIVFEVGDWQPGNLGFYDEIPIRFRIIDTGAHYHVPLILSPFGYTTYRGS